MREVAKRAGIDHSTLHYYFSGKEALIDGVVDHILKFFSILALSVKCPVTVRRPERASVVAKT